MEYKHELSPIAQSTLKFAKEEADRDFEKVRQKYIKKTKTHTVQLATSVEEYENALTELRLNNLKENLYAYCDKNAHLYDYVRALNAKKELDFKHKHNKIRRKGVSNEALMQEIATRRFESVKLENEIQLAKYNKEKFDSIELKDYQYNVKLDNTAKEIIETYGGVYPKHMSYEEFYNQMIANFEQLCANNRELMDSLFAKVNVLVKQNYEKISFTEQKAKLNELDEQKDEISKQILAVHKEIIDNDVDYKVLKIQLREKLPVEEEMVQVETLKKELSDKLAALEKQLTEIDKESEAVQKEIISTLKQNKKEFAVRNDFSELGELSNEEKEILSTINKCFATEIENVFNSLVETINKYATNNFVTFIDYKKEQTAKYLKDIEEYKANCLKELDESADVKVRNAYTLSLNDYLKSLHSENTDVKAKLAEIKEKFDKEFAEAKEEYEAEKAKIKEARNQRKEIYKEKKAEAKLKLKIAESSFEKTEIQDTLLVYKKEIKEGDKQKYQKAKENYKQKVKEIKRRYDLEVLGITNPQTVVVEQVRKNELAEEAKNTKVFEKRMNENLAKELSLAKYRKNMNKSQRENILGYIFLSVWAVGFVVLTLYPLIHTIFLSFSEVGYTTGVGYGKVFFGDGKFFPNWVGGKNYTNLFLSNTSFLYEQLPTFLMSLAFFLPIVVFIAFVLAMLLNTKIIGRTAFRLIYFLPVIIISGPLLTMLNESGAGGGNTLFLTIEGTFIHEILLAVSDQAVEYANFIFRNFIIILWMTGVPIILFISGLQKIDRSLYEAANIDGANKWQALWAVTFPLIKSVILIACLFTIVQISTIDVTGINPIKSSGNDAAPGIVELMNNAASQKTYGTAAAMAWVQTLIILVFVGLSFLLFREKEFVEKQKSYEEVERAKAKKAQRKAALKAFFRVDDIKRIWAKATGPIVRWAHARKLRKQKREEEGEE